jgi:hypothetical protein
VQFAYDNARAHSEPSHPVLGSSSDRPVLSSNGLPEGWQVVVRDGQTLLSGANLTLRLAGSLSSAERGLAAMLAFPVVLESGGCSGGHGSGHQLGRSR